MINIKPAQGACQGDSLCSTVSSNLQCWRMLQLSSQESAEMFDLALVLGCRLKYSVALGAELDRRFTHNFLVLPCGFQRRMLSIIVGVSFDVVICARDQHLFGFLRGIFAPRSSWEFHSIIQVSLAITVYKVLIDYATTILIHR